jgi:hypothetical protein
MNNFTDVIQFGIYLARLHFSDMPEIYKVRPVLVIDVDDTAVVALKMTSNCRHRARPVRFATVEKVGDNGRGVRCHRKARCWL